MCVVHSFQFYWRTYPESIDKTQLRCMESLGEESSTIFTDWCRRGLFLSHLWLMTFPRENGSQIIGMDQLVLHWKKSQQKTPKHFCHLALLLLYKACTWTIRGSCLLSKGVLKWWGISKANSLFFTIYFMLIRNEFVELSWFLFVLMLTFTSL